MNQIVNTMKFKNPNVITQCFKSCKKKSHQILCLKALITCRNCLLLPFHTVIELRHDKTNKMTMRPAKTQISLGIRPV